MRRFVTLVVLFLFAIPFGISISGCSKHAAPVFCNGGDSGITTGVVTTITLTPKVYGVSLNYAEIGQISTPSASDCKGTSASVGAYIYGTTDMTIADVEPSNGRLCGGTWNRNTGGGIPDFTYCTPTNKSGVAYVSASADGVTSNPLPVFIHPVVTSIVLGGDGSAATCATSNPTTACSSAATTGAVTAPAYSATDCVSQGVQAQLVARVYSGTGTNQTNISLLAGHLQFSAQNASVVSIDQDGVATAGQPGSTLISANISNAASSAGYFSTCPPASIALVAAGATTNPVVENQNNTQPLLASVSDTKGNPLTGLTLEYVSTTPTTIPAGSSITPTFAGSASITAICQPGSCNPASYSQIGLFGNGKPITSNPVNITAPGTNSTVLYLASTQSMEIVPVDFTASTQGAPFLLPYVPNSMVISNDGSTLYLGSATELMVVSAVNQLSLSRSDISSPGIVLAVSPDSSTVVLTDPIRQTVTLESSAGTVITTFGGVGTHAQWTADSQTVYITTGTVTTPATATNPAVIAPSSTVLVYSSFTGWTSTTDPVPALDVAITVPGVGAYFAGSTTTARGYCSISTPTTQSGVISDANVFYPPADNSPVTTDRIAATNDGLHVLGVTATPKATLNDLRVTIPTGACPLPTGTTSLTPIMATTTNVSPGLTFSSTPSTTTLSSIVATAITGVLPASDSSIAFVTYTGTGGVVPAYAPAASGQGTTTYVKLSGTAAAPIAGVISADNATLYVGTSGDNLVHLITRSTLTDASTLAPQLVTPGGAVVPVNLLAQKPRKTT